MAPWAWLVDTYKRRCLLGVRLRADALPRQIAVHISPHEALILDPVKRHFEGGGHARGRRVVAYRRHRKPSLPTPRDAFVANAETNNLSVVDTQRWR